MIKVGDTKNVVYNYIGKRKGKAEAKCIAIYEKDGYNMCLFETKNGIKTCVNDYFSFGNVLN